MDNKLTNTYIGCKKCNTVALFEVFVRRDCVELKCSVCGTIRLLEMSPELYISD